MASLNQQANAITNDVILPGDEVDYRLGSGDALVAMDPSESRQDVASALQNVNEEDPMDKHAIALSRGGSQHIATQAQFNAMSPHQKAVIRAAVNGGGTIKASDGLKFYQDSLKQARALQINTVTTSDGRKVDIVNGQIIPAAKEPEAVKREIRETADGLRAIDPSTGESFQVYDKYSGSAVTGKPKISEDNRVQFNQAHIELQRIQSELNQVNAIPTNKKVTQDDNGMWVPSDSFFGGENPEKVKARLLKAADYQSEKIRKIDPTNSVSAASASQPSATPAPAASPSPTPNVTRSAEPRPNPMPTPDQFETGKRYRDAKGNVAIYRGNGVFE